MGRVEDRDCKEDSWVVVSCIGDESMRTRCLGKKGCDHDRRHWMVLVGFSETEASEFQTENELFHCYVDLVANALSCSFVEARNRLYLVSTGEGDGAYGFCVELDGFHMLNTLRDGEHITSAGKDCGWSLRDNDPFHVKRKKDMNQENIAVKASLGIRKSTELKTTFKGTSKSRKVVDNLRGVTEHAEGPPREITENLQGMRPLRSLDRKGWRGGYIWKSSHASQSNMKLESKSSQKSTFVGHVPTGSDAVSVLPPKDHSTDSVEEADQLWEKLSRVTLNEADRRLLIFEIFGGKCYPSWGISPGLQVLENQEEVSSGSFRSTSVFSEDVNQADLLNRYVESSYSASPAHPSPDKIESQSTRELESYADIRMFRNNNASYASLPRFVTSRTHVENSMPVPSESMIQQQTVSQMYPQFHASHFPIRHFSSPVYMPPMGVPGGLKYGASQYNQSGYALNSQGTVGGATGFDDSTKMKFKDGNPHILNPQAEPYIPSHAGNASFSCAVTGPPTQFQYPGLYHSYQQAAVANPYHMGTIV